MIEGCIKLDLLFLNRREIFCVSACLPN
jgi:hypothetical protein